MRMRVAIWWVFTCVIAVAPLSGQATNDQISYSPPPAWVVPGPSIARWESTPADGQISLIYQDIQVFADRGNDQIYQAYRVRLLGPQALVAGNLSLSWNPADGGATVHFVRVWRNGNPIDVLKTTHYTVLRREEALEQAKLDGLLTAVMQVPDLQVGDELEVAATIERRNATLKDFSFGFIQLPLIGSNGEYRTRLSWPLGSAPMVRNTPDLDSAITRDAQSFTVSLKKPAAIVPPEQVPLRFQAARQLEYSNFQNWQDLSRAMDSLFTGASRLASDSTLREQIRKIQAQSGNSRLQAEAALRLVQDEVRYVYVGVNGGNLQPATADETWQRKFGDCKAKTVLLLALLKELGIPARAVLVNSLGGDGIDGYLPSPELFDHVLVRASLGGVSYWLDGTRAGDSRLLTVPPGQYRWVLPLSAMGEPLSRGPISAPSLPLFVSITDIDSTAGVDKPARVKFQRVFRGDLALALRWQLAIMPVEDAASALKTEFRKDNAWFLPEQAQWRYDEKAAAVILNVSGTGDLEWKKYDDPGAVGWTIFGYGYYPPARRERLNARDNSLPWAIEFPVFNCFVTTLRLPAPGAGLKWDHSGNDMSQAIAGTTYWRMAELKDGIFRMISSTRNEVPEISAASAAAANARIADFDNNTASVFMARKVDPAPMRQIPVKSITEVPTADAVDWVADDTLCVPREQ